MLNRTPVFCATGLSMPIRFAILGAGRIGQFMPAPSPAMMMRFLPLFSPCGRAASAISTQYGAQIRNVDEIASAADIDAVVLCTPTDLHAEQIEMFSRAGKRCSTKSRSISTRRGSSSWSLKDQRDTDGGVQSPFRSALHGREGNHQ